MNVISGLPQIPDFNSKVKMLPGVQQKDKEQEPGQPTKPRQDEYIPGAREKQEPTGQYWLGKDEEGQPKIFFDDPEKAAPDAEKPADDAEKKAAGPGKKPAGGKPEKVIGSTDKVDREIEKLKKKMEALQQQINSETDETKIKELQRKLDQVEGELRQKDNDTYRRSHMQITKM